MVPPEPRKENVIAKHKIYEVLNAQQKAQCQQLHHWEEQESKNIDLISSSRDVGILY